MISNPPATARIGALLGFAMLVLLGCATNPAVVDHAFGFDVRYDGQDGGADTAMALRTCRCALNP
jgi:hypothetical protein